MATLNEFLEKALSETKEEVKKKDKKIDEGKLMPEVIKAKKLSGKELEDIMYKLYNQAYEVLYNLDVVLSNSYGKAEDKGIKDARTITQKALGELGFINWSKAMEKAFKS
jgi:hypothetical protein